MPLMLVSETSMCQCTPQGFSKPVLFFDCFSAHLLSSPAPTPSTRQTLEALIDTDVGIMNVSRQ